MSETGGMPIEKQTCARCRRGFDGRAFPFGRNVPICYHCVNEERTDRAIGQTNIFDEGAVENDPLHNNEITLPRKDDRDKQRYFSNKARSRKL